MNTHLICDLSWSDVASRAVACREQGVSAVLIRSMPHEAGLYDLLPMLEKAAIPCLVEIADSHEPEAFLEGVRRWPAHISLLIWGLPERIAQWHGHVAPMENAQAAEVSDHAVAAGTKEEADTASEHGGEVSVLSLPRIVAGLRARHKETSFSMSPGANLSGFSFYMPTQGSFEGYEIVLPGSDAEELSHEERMEEYDLRRWLGRFIKAVEPMDPVFLLHSETADARGAKGLDIEMSAYCRDTAGVKVIASGGLATVRHVLNFEREGRGLAVVFPAEVNDGSFTIHDVRNFVDEEMAKTVARDSRLSLGVLAGGRLAGVQGRYWQAEPDQSSGKPKS